MTQLQDDSPMPFGKHKGIDMKKVPAKYLHWLWTNLESATETSDVADYIARNIEALRQEYPNGIW
jgi:hypothetical protein